MISEATRPSLCCTCQRKMMRDFSQSDHKQDNDRLQFTAKKATAYFIACSYLLRRLINSIKQIILEGSCEVLLWFLESSFQLTRVQFKKLSWIKKIKTFRKPRSAKTFYLSKLSVLEGTHNNSWKLIFFCVFLSHLQIMIRKQIKVVLVLSWSILKLLISFIKEHTQLWRMSIRIWDQSREKRDLGNLDPLPSQRNCFLFYLISRVP